MPIRVFNYFAFPPSSFEGAYSASSFKSRTCFDLRVEEPPFLVAVDVERGGNITKNYVSFSTPEEYFAFVEDVPDTERHYYEMYYPIRGLYIRPYADIDIKLGEPGFDEISTRANDETLVDYLLERINAARERLWADADGERARVSICSSSDERKFSFHVVLPGICLQHTSEAKRFAEALIEEGMPGVDLAPYGASSQTLRMYSSCKHGSTRVKRMLIDPRLSSDRYDTLFTWVKGTRKPGNIPRATLERYEGNPYMMTLEDIQMLAETLAAERRLQHASAAENYRGSLEESLASISASIEGAAAAADMSVEEFEDPLMLPDAMSADFEAMLGELDDGFDAMFAAEIERLPEYHYPPLAGPLAALSETEYNTYFADFWDRSKRREGDVPDWNLTFGGEVELKSKYTITRMRWDLEGFARMIQALPAEKYVHANARHIFKLAGDVVAANPGSITAVQRIVGAKINFCGSADAGCVGACAFARGHSHDVSKLGTYGGSSGTRFMLWSARKALGEFPLTVISSVSRVCDVREIMARNDFENGEYSIETLDAKLMELNFSNVVGTDGALRGKHELLVQIFGAIRILQGRSTGAIQWSSAGSVRRILITAQREFYTYMRSLEFTWKMPVEGDDASFAMKKVSLYDLMKPYLAMLRVSDVVSDPRLPRVRDGVLNLVTPFFHAVRSTPDRSLIAPWLEHVDYMFADPRERAWMLNWFAHIIQKDEPSGKAPYIFSRKQGVGKNMLLLPLQRLLRSRSLEVTLLSQLVTHDGPLASAKLVVANETGFQRASDTDMQFVKSWITDEFLSVRELYRERVSVYNMTNWIFLGNASDAIRLESASQRRLVYFHVAEVKREAAYYARLKAACSHPLFSDALYMFLKEYNYSDAILMDTDTLPSHAAVTRETMRNQLPMYPSCLLALFEEKGGAEPNLTIINGEIDRFVKEWGEREHKAISFNRVTKWINQNVPGAIVKLRPRAAGSRVRTTFFDLNAFRAYFNEQLGYIPEEIATAPEEGGAA